MYARTTRIDNLISMRVSNRIVPTSECCLSRRGLEGVLEDEARLDRDWADLLLDPLDDDLWLRTNGVDTSGAAVEVMMVDRLGQILTDICQMLTEL